MLTNTLHLLGSEPDLLDTDLGLRSARTTADGIPLAQIDGNSAAKSDDLKPDAVHDLNEHGVLAQGAKMQRTGDPRP